MESLNELAYRVAQETEGFHWEGSLNPFISRLVTALGAQEPVAWRVVTKTATGFSCWINYYDFGAANSPLNNDGTWKEKHCHHWQFNDSPSKQLQLVSVEKLYTAPQLPQREGWQPIETAPKDGAKVLLARCGKNEAGTDLGVWWACNGFWSSRWNNWNDGVEPCGLAHPTHWMPLPDAPNA